MTQSREQFEAHYDGWTNSGCGYSLHHRMGNSYDLPDISKAWAHWQASRDALIIELPVRSCIAAVSGMNYHKGWNDALEWSRKNIEEDGLKVKLWPCGAT